jgi:hypothetical protein
MSTWVYINSEPGLWTVGFFAPDGEWHSDSDHSIREEAAKRVAYLNGGANAVEYLEKLSRSARRLSVMRP